ncbi:MAG: cobalamin-dependent protein [Deltaproteobacteria bacterium]|nr:cobalamin-dependent protein [Deltaproteobacteria bacterium]
MRVLLVTPFGFQNVGIRLLSAVLVREGIDCSILFLKRWINNRVFPPTETEWSLFENHVKELAPDVVGIGFGTPYLKLVTEMTERIRRVSKAHVTWGGTHPTMVPEDCVGRADSVILGEGEAPLVDLVNALKSGADITGIKNIWTRAGDREFRNELRPLIADLDTLPHERMLEAPRAFIAENRMYQGDPLHNYPVYRALASRYCPFHCAFCYNSQYRDIYDSKGRYFRNRSVGNVMIELERVRREMPRTRRIHFDDDTFVFPVPWIEEFAEEYPRRIGLPFDIMLYPGALGEKAIRLLAKAGLTQVQIGIQSASEEELARDHARRDANDAIRKLAALFKELKVEPVYDIILDNPDATRADKDATLKFMVDLPRPYNLFLYSLTFFPKSEVTRNLLERHVITEEQIETRATKTFRQFRLTLDYPRPAEEKYYASMISLASKNFLPRPLIRWLARRESLRRRPEALRWFAEGANMIKLAKLAARAYWRGEFGVGNVPLLTRRYARMIQ